MQAALITMPLGVQLLLYVDLNITRRLLDIAIILFAGIMGGRCGHNLTSY